MKNIINLSLPNSSLCVMHSTICKPSNNIIKKVFFCIFALTPSHMWLKRPVYRSFSGEGKCEGKLSPLTLALTPKSKIPLVLPRHNPNQNENQKINQKLYQKTNP